MLSAWGCGGDGAVNPDTDEGTASDAPTETDEGDAVPPALLADPQIIVHPNQPMVVDVIVEIDRPGVVELSHDDDPGVHVASLAIDDEGRRHHLRVRGLAPDTAHALTLVIQDADDPSLSDSRALSFTTRPPLPGFRPSFEVDVTDAAAVDPAYRLFDYAYLPLTDPVGIFVVDPLGTTRWYYGGPPGWLGLTAIWAGVELLDDGSILATRDGAVMILDELGEQRLNASALLYDLPVFHHEAVMLANGNILTLSNSFEVHDYSALGLAEEQLVAGDLLVEINLDGELVWTWDAFDHLDPVRLRSSASDGLAYYDRKSGKYGFDWTHGNGMTEIIDDDLILVSMRHQDWIVAVDHQSGEVVWRLGPEGDFELLEGTWFFHQHSPQWLADDNSLLLYDNGLGNPEVPISVVESRAVRYALDFDAMTATQIWDSRHGEPYLSPVAGDADRTPVGNVLVLDSALQPDPDVYDLGKNYSRLVEVHGEGEPSPIWTLTTKIGSYVYRATPIDRLPGE